VLLRCADLPGYDPGQEAVAANPRREPMTEPTWISVLPPLLAIALAIATRQVYLSLASGIWLGWTILAGWNPLAGLADAIDGTVAVLGDPGNARVILFTLVIGALIATVEASGGVRGFVQWVEHRNFVTNGRRAQFLAWIIGVIIFIESNITVLVSGAISRPLFDRFRVSSEKLAYIIDSTSAPICILIPLNAWGAYVLGLLGESGIDNPLAVFLRSIPLNFYALAAVTLVFATIALGLDIGPMRRAERGRARASCLSDTAAPMLDPEILAPPPNEKIPPRADQHVPAHRGHGADDAGRPVHHGRWRHACRLGFDERALGRVDGARRVMAAARRAARVHGGRADAYRTARRRRPREPCTRTPPRPVARAPSRGSSGPASYLAQATAGMLPPAVFLPLVFIVAAGIAFSTGTSWGTFAIMIPIAVPAAQALGMPPETFLAAALSGGIFGDHASPISDTTIIASMASATDHIDHVRTQLPYALIAAAVATIAFSMTGAFLG
jgi:tetracycline resistance efflux pump